MCLYNNHHTCLEILVFLKREFCRDHVDSSFCFGAHVRATTIEGQAKQPGDLQLVKQFFAFASHFLFVPTTKFDRRQTTAQKIP